MTDENGGPEDVLGTAKPRRAKISIETMRKRRRTLEQRLLDRMVAQPTAQLKEKNDSSK